MRRNDRRESIMEVAAKSFLEHGYAATTMSGITATVGGSKGTLWNYFPSKEGLFEAVLDRVTAVYRGQMLEMLANTDGDLRVTLHNVGLKLLAKATSRDAIALNRLVLAEAARFPEVGRIFYDRAPRQTQNLLAQFLGGNMSSSPQAAMVRWERATATIRWPSHCPQDPSSGSFTTSRALQAAGALVLSRRHGEAAGAIPMLQHVA